MLFNHLLFYLAQSNGMKNGSSIIPEDYLTGSWYVEKSYGYIRKKTCCSINYKIPQEL